MLYSLISGLRNIRVSLVTGGIIVISTYIFLYGVLFDSITVRPVMLRLLELSSLVPLIIIIGISLLIGSLYTTLLEGIIDDIHRKHVNISIITSSSNIRNMVISSMLPYSGSAKKRLTTESIRFYKEYYKEKNIDGYIELENDFVEAVLIETLWMEGKIAGTTIEQPYDRIRSDGEMRVAGGLLLPYACTAIAYSLYATEVQMFLAFLCGIILSISMVNYGLYYYKKANSFLAHHIADGKVLSPSMETLKRTYLNEDLTLRDAHAFSHTSVFTSKLKINYKVKV